jgi:glycosyltransferase involved in cell wall biosynthesis
MNNIVLLCQVFHPNPCATSSLLTELVLNLQNHHNKVTVICGFPNEVEDLAVNSYENFNGIDIHRCGVKINSKAGLWQRIISYAFYVIHATWKLVFLKEKDMIFGVTNPPFLSILLLLVSVITGWKYYFILHDVYPEGLVAVGKLKEKSFITKIWHNLNRYSYQSATKLVVLGRDMKDLLVQNYGLEPDKIEYIPNWSITPTDLPIPIEKNDLAIELGIQNKFVIQYSGNMGLWHDIDTFIRVAAQLKTNKEIQFLFIGNGIRKQKAHQLAQELELTNIIWMDFVPKEQLSTSLTCAHVALISLNTGLEGIAVPCKLYGILASGRAILAQVPAKSEIAYTIIEEECGFVIPPGDVDGLVKRIQQLESDRDLTSKMGLRSFQAYKSKYTIETIAKQFRKMLELNTNV